jgi:transcriptional regulator with XRE-family HTH domain
MQTGSDSKPYAVEVIPAHACVSRSTIQVIEKSENISLVYLLKIAEALGIEPGDLFLTEKDREDITYKTKILFDRLSKMFDFEEKKRE